MVMVQLLSVITIQLRTHVSCVPKKKIGILLGGGFTAPSATSSICKQGRHSSEKQGGNKFITQILGLEDSFTINVDYNKTEKMYKCILSSSTVYLMHVNVNFVLCISIIYRNRFI